MTMADAGMVALWAAAGLLCGTGYVAGLRANVRAYLGGGPPLRTAALHLLRLVLVGAAFTAAAAMAGLAGLLGLLAGFLVARTAMLHGPEARP